jgi:hypothetical protein
MKKLLIALTLALLALPPTRAADTVELLPGKITGTISLSSESIQGGSVSASATDGSSSASASLSGSTYSLVVPAGKSWRLNFNLNTQVASGSYSSISFNVPGTIIAVAADQTVTNNVAVTTARIAATVQVANGTLTSIPSLQAYGNNGLNPATSFNAYAQNLPYILSLPFNNVTVYGSSLVSSTSNQSSTQTLSSKTTNVTTAGGSVAWSIDAAFASGTIAGALNLLGAATPTSASIYLYNPSGSYVAAKNLQGNGSYQFDNVMVGTNRLNFYTNFPNAQLYYYRNAAVTAAATTQVDLAGNVAVAQTTLNLSGFLTRAKISGGSLQGYWVAPNPNPDGISASAYASINTTNGFSLALVPGDWRIYNLGVNGYDYSTPGVYISYSLGIYDYQRANQNITVAAGETKTIPSFDLNTTQTELTFDVIEPAGAASETLISDARVNGYVTTYNGSTPLYQYSFNSSTSTSSPQARQRVRIIGAPGIYNVQTYGTVSGSNVSFGNFSLELKAPLPTPVGTDVTVNAGTGVTLVFDNVTTAGVSTASQLPVGPALPAGYSILTNSGAKVYYGISTTAAFTGFVDVTVNYAAAAVAPALEPRLKLFYYDNTAQTWLDVTVGVDQANNKITGTAPALSLFAVGVANDPVVSSVMVPVDGLKATSLSFSALFTDGDSNDTHTANWNWGDGTTSAGTINATTRAVTGTHSYAQAGTYSGSVTVTDATGTTATKTFTVAVGGGDSTPPAITVAGSITAEATDATGAVVTFNVTALDETDGTVVVTTSPASGSTFALGTTQVIATARDSAGNVTTKTFAVVVSDTTKPVIAVPPAATLEATTATGAVFTYATSATDTVSGSVAVTASHASGSVFPVGATTVTLTATDTAGNIATTTFVVTVADTTAPVITAPATITAEATSAAGAVVTFATTATDLGGAAAVTTSIASGSTFPVGTTTVVITAKDASNNTSTKTFDVVVRDTTVPVIANQANLTAEATSAAGAVVTFAPTATDLGAAATVTTSVASGSTFPVGVTTVTITAKDTSNNTSTKSFTVTVSDTTKPVLTAPANVTAEATSAAGATVTFAATAADNVGATVTYSKAPGTVFPIGTTTVTANATDAAGNVAAPVTFTVTVRDTSGPVLSLPTNLIAEATDDDGTKVTFAVTATDLVSGARSVTVSRSSGSKFPLGVTTITATAKDALGNTTVGTFTVTVRDTTAPKLKLPKNLTVSATSAAGATVRYGVDAEDIVSEDKQITFTYSKASGSVFPLGTTTVTVTAKDKAGNIATGTFTVTVKDSTAPVFTKLTATPSRILLNDRSMVNVAITALATDRIDPTLNLRIVSVTSDDPVTGTSPADVGPDWEITGPLTLKLRAERDAKDHGRIYTISVAATDDSGNTTTRTLHVLVAKNSSVRFEDCDSQHRSESKRCDDEKREHDRRDQGDRDDDDNDDNDRKARGK